jgi:hypothetical protein
MESHAHVQCKPKLLDLFTGTGSVARVAESLGYEVHTFDIDRRCKPDICADILEFPYKDVFVPGQFDVVWASCPCETFSCARKCNIGRRVKGEVMTAETLARDRETIGVPILRRTQEIIKFLQPKAYFIENPYTGAMKDYIEAAPAVFDYCMYGKMYRKRTAIWSNMNLISCLCDRSHLVNGRHAMTAIGTSKTQQGQGGGSSKDGRFAVPRDLIVYLLSAV